MQWSFCQSDDWNLFWLKFTISLQCWNSIRNHCKTSRKVFLAHSVPIYPYTAWLRIRTDIFSTIPVSILLVLKRSRYWSWLIHRNAESFIIWSIMSSWFCLGELGSKRAPITHSSIFSLASKLQHDFALCGAIDSRDLRAGFSRSNLIAEIPECWHAQKNCKQHFEHH